MRNNNKHELVLGITRSGKTYFTSRKKRNGINLYIDIKAEIKKGKVLTVDNTLRELKHSFKYYKEITFHCSNDSRQAKKEIDIILGYLEKYEKNNLINIIIDEVADFIPQGESKSNIFKIARRGLKSEKKGLRLVLVGQSPADIDKKAVKQCERIRIFKLNDWSYKYLNRLGLPSKDIKRMLDKSKKYSHILLENGKAKIIKPI